MLDASTAGAASSVGPERLEYLEAAIVRNKTKDKVSMNRCVAAVGCRLWSHFLLGRHECGTEGNALRSLRQIWV